MNSSNKFKSLLTYLSLGLVGSSVGLNFFLYTQLKKYYIELNQVRLDPLGLSYYNPDPKFNDKAGKRRVILFGDSRAESWPSPDIAGYEFINRGVDGQTSAQTSQRLSYHIGDLQPDVVVIQVGVNDLKAIPLMPDHRDLIVTLCRGNIRRMIEESRALGATVIVSTILPVGEASLIRKPVWSPDIKAAIDEINGYIKSLADDQVIVFDGFSTLADSQGLMPVSYRLDELHLNEEGYMILNQAFIETLNTVEFPAEQTATDNTQTEYWTQ